jgi:hypothetical protein
MASNDSSDGGPTNRRSLLKEHPSGPGRAFCETTTCVALNPFYGPAILQSSGDARRHYHLERNHQGLHNRLIQPIDEAGKSQGEIA